MIYACFGMIEWQDKNEIKDLVFQIPDKSLLDTFTVRDRNKCNCYGAILESNRVDLTAMQNEFTLVFTPNTVELANDWLNSRATNYTVLTGVGGCQFRPDLKDIRFDN